jgi:iron only hydrogenase large subunit-like protein
MEYGSPNFFGFAYNQDQLKLLDLLKEAKRGKTKLCLMVAPAFIVDFDSTTFPQSMQSLGFDKVTEITFGAKIVNQNYHEYIKEHYSDYASGKKKKDKNFQSVFIASVCPASVSLIQNSFPHLKKYLMPFDSPMVSMAKILRKEFPKHKIVFLAPCGAKKVEAKSAVDKKGKQLIEHVITFAEMKQVLAKEKPFIFGEGRGFDSFYNEYTKIYPLSGGLSATLHTKGILRKNELMNEDGVLDLKRLFEKEASKVFYDILFCSGGCIGGPGVASRMPLRGKKLKVLKYRKKSAITHGKRKKGLEKYTKGINFSKRI